MTFARTVICVALVAVVSQVLSACGDAGDEQPGRPPITGGPTATAPRAVPVAASTPDQRAMRLREVLRTWAASQTAVALADAAAASSDAGKNERAGVLLSDRSGRYGTANVDITQPPVAKTVAECADFEQPCQVRDHGDGFAKVYDYRAGPRTDQSSLSVEVYSQDGSLLVRLVASDAVNSSTTTLWNVSPTRLPDFPLAPDQALTLADQLLAA